MLSKRTMRFVYSMASRFVIILFFPLGFIPQIILWVFRQQKIERGEEQKRDKYIEENYGQKKKDKVTNVVCICQLSVIH